MMSAVELQNNYVNLYTQLRKYIWGFNEVNAIADLEVSVYSRFPDISSVKSSFSRVKAFLRPILDEDIELEEAVDDFEDSINEQDTFFAKLSRLQEVI